MLSDEERQALLRHARAALTARLARQPAPEPPPLEHPTAHSGAFVTVESHGDLRGCIGFPGAAGSLADVVADAAIAAGTEDPRFPPVAAAELSQLHFEISVLTPIEPVESVADIEVGRDGLVASDGYRRGLLLPQVATEYGWSREEFLAHTCMKAGLRPDAWKTGATISRFQAEVFGEEERQG